MLCNTAVQRITCAQIRTVTQLLIGKKQHKVRRLCLAMLGVDLGWSVCVSDGIQHNIIHDTIFARMMSRLVIKMAWDNGSYVVTQCVCYAGAHQPPLHSINCQN